MTESLARFGGTPVVDRDTLSASFGRWPDVRDEDLEAVCDVLRARRSPYGFLHPSVLKFQRAYARHVGGHPTLALSSGTAALHLSLLALDLPAGTEVITSALGYVASAAAILHAGLEPVFVDIDPATYNLCPAAVERAMSARSSALVAVDLLGLPADYDALMALGLPVVADASQSQGARYGGRPVGALGTVSAASLMATKNLPSAGEGGVLATSDPDIARRARAHASLGMDLWRPDGPSPVAHQLGFNYRPTPVSMAFAEQQLDRLEGYHRARTERALRFGAGIADIDFLAAPHVPDDRDHAYLMYRLRVCPERVGLSAADAIHLRDAFVFLVRAEGGLAGFWEETLLPDMPLFARRDGRVGPTEWPEARAALDSTFYAAVTTATHPQALIDGQIAAYRKVAAHVDVVVDLARSIRDAGGFARWSGFTIRNEAGLRGRVLQFC